MSVTILIVTTATFLATTVIFAILYRGLYATAGPAAVADLEARAARDDKRIRKLVKLALMQELQIKKLLDHQSAAIEAAPKINQADTEDHYRDRYGESVLPWTWWGERPTRDGLV